MNYLPEELQKVQQNIARLEIEKVALKNEKETKKNQDRIATIDKELSVLKEKEKLLKANWDEEKEDIQKLSSTKQNIEQLKSKLPILQSEGKYVEASKIMYVLIPELQKTLKFYENKINNKKHRLIKELVDAEEVATIVSRWTKIPVSKLLEAQKEKLMNLEKSLSKRVKGQDEAIKLVSETIRRAKANINDPNRPIGSFLFLGPTGVGKTELAKALAENLFDDENRIIRLDMSEYMEKHSVSKLIGSPPGYIGYEKGGQLTEKVRQNPYSIVLFDEIEKANIDVLNLLLQIMDNGALTDSRGRLINFRNTIIIMTSNIGATDDETPAKNAQDEQIKELKKLLLNNQLKPEFVNRIDEVIKFNSLDKKVIEQIVLLEINKLKLRLFRNQNITINVDDEVISFIAKNAYDEAFGARPIRRYIQNNLESKLASLIIDNKIKSNDNIPVIIDKNEIKIVTKKDEFN